MERRAREKRLIREAEVALSLSHSFASLSQPLVISDSKSLGTVERILYGVAFYHTLSRALYIPCGRKGMRGWGAKSSFIKAQRQPTKYSATTPSPPPSLESPCIRGHLHEALTLYLVLFNQFLFKLSRSLSLSISI